MLPPTVRNLALALALSLGIASAPLSPVRAEQVEAALPAVVQVALTDEMLDRFAKAQEKMSEIEFESPRGSFSGVASDDPDLYAALETVAKENGFADMAEMQKVSDTLAFVMMGIDGETGAFTEPQEILKAEIAAVAGNADIPAEEKAEVTKDLEARLAMTPRLEHSGNVEIVKAFLKRLAAAANEG